MRNRNMKQTSNTINKLKPGFFPIISHSSVLPMEIFHSHSPTQICGNSFSPSPRCFHPTIFNGVCVYCTKKMEDGYGVCFDYMLKGLRFSNEEVIRLKEINSDIVFQQKKLHLVLDLDHTLLHAVKFETLASDDHEHFMRRVRSLEDISDSDLLKISSDELLLKLRPYVRTFLREASTMYDIYICTMGTRPYAEQIAKLLDPKCEYFINSRLITREDFKQRDKKNLDLVLGQEKGILIVDDTEEVWTDHKENLILVRGYNYFKEKTKNHKSYSERKTDESEMNGALANVLRTLKTIHGIYFDNSQANFSCGSGDVRILLSIIRRQILSDCTLLFTEDVEKFPLLQWRAEELGAACTNRRNSSVTHVVSERQGTKDCQWAEQQKKYLVHPRWIYAAYYLWKRQSERDYFPI